MAPNGVAPCWRGAMWIRCAACDAQLLRRSACSR
ncbi:MAG: hypothetical protein EVA65_06595 [Oceanococcus sp.]|nr:MAG: hypothetical protein EVA65_06595 [Oceanococcus sp.]